MVSRCSASTSRPFLTETTRIDRYLKRLRIHRRDRLGGLLHDEYDQAA
jgi:hypothetical protein